MKKILCIIGGILVFCGIGACDIGTGTFGQALMQCVVGLPMIAIGVM